MEPIKEEDRRNSQTTTTESERNDTGDSCVDPESGPEPPTEKDKARSKKKLRFQRIRQSLGSVSSDCSEKTSETASDIHKPTKPQRPTRWHVGMRKVELSGVPGSIVLFDDDDTKQSSSTITSPPSVQSEKPSMLHGFPRSATSTPKTNALAWRKRAKNSELILDPQPEESPNDPLNWPRWKKELAFVTLGLLTFLGGTMTTPFPSGLADRKSDLNLSALRLGLVNAIFMVGLALGHIFLAPTAIVYGKRLVYLLCAWTFVGSCIWAAFSPLYGSLIGARFLMGVTLSPVEILVPSSITELFHLHTRGIRLGIYVFLYLGGTNITSIISGAVIMHTKWRWLFWIWALLGVLSLSMVFLFVPESYFDRTFRPIHMTTCPKHRRKAGSIRSARTFRSYFSHCTCPVFSPGSPHPGKPVTFERLSPGAIEQRVQEHRERVLARIKAERKEDAGPSAEIIVSPPPAEPEARSLDDIVTSPKVNSIVSPRKVGFADELSGDEAPRTPIRPMSVRRLHSDVRGSNEEVGAKEHATLSPPTASPPRRSGRPRAISQSSSASNVTVASAPRIAPLSRSHSTRSILRPLSRKSSHNRNENGELAVVHTKVPVSDLDADGWPMRPSLRLDLEDIMFDRESVGAFTQDTALSGYQNGMYFRSLGASSAGGMTSVSAAITACASNHHGGCPGAGWTYTERLRANPMAESWVEGLRVWRGRVVDESWLALACKPLVLLAVVARTPLCWAAPVWALSVASMAVLPRAVSLLFVGPSGADVAALPTLDSAAHYAFNPTQAGALSLASLIGLLLGTVFAGTLAEFCVRAMARRNGGVFEPEFRLMTLVVPALILAGIGSMGFGWVVQDQQPWIVPAVFLGFIGFGCGTAALAALNYAVDCVPGAVVEAMVVLAVVKNLVPGVVLNLTLDTWIRARGSREVFVVIGALHLLVLLAAVPIYMFGKKARAQGRRMEMPPVPDLES